MFHQDNAAAHKYLDAMDVVQDCGLKTVDNLSYSPYLVPSEYHLVLNIKKALDWAPMLQ